MNPRQPLRLDRILDRALDLASVEVADLPVRRDPSIPGNLVLQMVDDSAVELRVRHPLRRVAHTHVASSFE
ncbi:MAG: hypothetical protein AB1486_11550 [Planctomycetota bacterium]